MNIRLTSKTAFHFAPRRLSYLEKEKVTNIIDDLLDKK